MYSYTWDYLYNKDKMKVVYETQKGCALRDKMNRIFSLLLLLKTLKLNSGYGEKIKFVGYEIWNSVTKILLVLHL